MNKKISLFNVTFDIHTFPLSSVDFTLKVGYQLYVLSPHAHPIKHEMACSKAKKYVHAHVWIK